MFLAHLKYRNETSGWSTPTRKQAADEVRGLTRSPTLCVCDLVGHCNDLAYTQQDENPPEGLKWGTEITQFTFERSHWPPG